jgi:tight adherence protein B
MALALNSVKEGYFQPLSGSIFGYIAAFAAGFFWLASLILARKVLAVDI